MASDRVTAPRRTVAITARPARIPRAGRRRWALPIGPRSRRLEVTKVRLPGEVLLVLDGALRRATVDPLAAAVESVGRRARLVIDLCFVGCLDRVGLQALAAICGAREGDVWLVGASARVRRSIRRHAAPLQAHLVATT
jgi:hypothetical protein